MGRTKKNKRRSRTAKAATERFQVAAERNCRKFLQEIRRPRHGDGRIFRFTRLGDSDVPAPDLTSRVSRRKDCSPVRTCAEQHHRTHQSDVYPNRRSGPKFAETNIRWVPKTKSRSREAKSGSRVRSGAKTPKTARCTFLSLLQKERAHQRALFSLTKDA